MCVSRVSDLFLIRSSLPSSLPSSSSSSSSTGLTAIMTQSQLEDLQRMKPSEIKKKLRALGVAPEDHPQVVEKSDLIRLYQAAVQRKAAREHDSKNARDLATTTAASAAAVGRKGQPKTPQEMRAQMQKEQREAMMKKQEELKKEMEERTARGESFAMIKALMAVYQKEAASVKVRLFLPPSFPPSFPPSPLSCLPSLCLCPAGKQRALLRTSYYSSTHPSLPPSLPPSLHPCHRFTDSVCFAHAWGPCQEDSARGEGGREGGMEGGLVRELRQK